MMRRHIGIVGVMLATAAALSGHGAKAQQLGTYAQPLNGFSPMRGQPGERLPLRVQVQYHIQAPSDRNAALDDQKSTIEAGHAALYDLARRECDALQKSFDGDCRVVALNVGNTGQGFGPGEALQLNATATIEIVPRPPVQPVKPQ